MPFRRYPRFLPFAIRPFEAATAIYGILNGFLTFNWASPVLVTLWNAWGVFSFFFPFMQMVAGIHILIGMGVRKSNLEVAGLSLLSAMFLVRAVATLIDGDITLADLNTCLIAVLLCLSSVVRVISLIWGPSVTLEGKMYDFR